MTCKRTQGFLANHSVAVSTMQDAKKQTITGKDALAVLEGMDHLYAAKGKHIVHFDLRATQPSKAELLAVLLGPTGNLRAPTVRKGRKLLIGFSEELYRRVVT